MWQRNRKYAQAMSCWCAGDHLKFTMWFSRMMRNRSLMSSKRSFSSTFTVLSPSGLRGPHENTQTSYSSAAKRLLALIEKSQKTSALPDHFQLQRSWQQIVRFYFIFLTRGSPFFTLKRLLSHFKLEYARSLRGSLRIWALEALWGS